MSVPLVSVVMPVLDPEPRFLEAAVHSILEQTLGDLELIVVEDPRGRSARAVLERARDPRIRHLCDGRLTSLSEQRNLGLIEARSDLVALLDSDDIAAAPRLAEQLRFLRQHPTIDVLGSQLAVIDDGGRRLGYRVYPVDHDSILACMPEYDPVAQPSVMFRRNVVLRHGGYRHMPAATDYDLWSRLALAGRRFANLDQPLTHYRIHPGAMKASRLRITIRSTLEVKRRYWTGAMRPRARVRALGERLLLLLPPPLVLRLFLATHLRRRAPGWSLAHTAARKKISAASSSSVSTVPSPLTWSRNAR